MRRVMWMVATALLLGTGTSFATSGYRGDWEIGGYGGYGWLDDYELVHPKDNALFGARLGYFFTPDWSAEISAQRLPTERDTIGGEDVEVKLDAYRFNLFYNFSRGAMFRPFLTAGIGSERIDVEGIVDEHDFGWNIGAGFRWFLSGPWQVRVDGRMVGANVEDIDAHVRNVELTGGLSLLFGGHGDEETVVETRPANQPPTVTCAPERQEILPGETVNIVVTASDPEGDPLTYVWTSNTGRVLGPGATGRIDFPGVTPPATANVTVKVSDGHGNVTTCETMVRLIEPVKPAESASCLAGGFPRNLSRLNNVDKACLDDYVQRLKADPRAHIVVIGHADTRESNPSRVGEQRADAVKQYLVTAGIEASRITTRSAGDSRPMGTTSADAATNRRVEVWFVPEGAKEPE